MWDRREKIVDSLLFRVAFDPDNDLLDVHLSRSARLMYKREDALRAF